MENTYNSTFSEKIAAVSQMMEKYNTLDTNPQLKAV